MRRAARARGVRVVSVTVTRARNALAVALRLSGRATDTSELSLRTLAEIAWCEVPAMRPRLRRAARDCALLDLLFRDLPPDETSRNLIALRPNGVAWGRHLRSVQHATDTAYPLRALDPTESILPRDVVALTLAHRILAP